MKQDVLNIKGKLTGREIVLNKSIFQIQPNEHAVYLDVKQYLAHQRTGTHKSKERSEIKGSTRKIKRQKGTGTARAGSIKNPIFRGGGRTFGPRVRSYTQKVNKSVKKLARKSALSIKVKSKNLTVIEDFDFDIPKTKSILKVLEALGISAKKSLFVLDNSKKNVFLSARNLKNINVLSNDDLNTYNIMNAQHLIISEVALETIEKNLLK
jgi:large subunit ribosomal protein L4